MGWKDNLTVVLVETRNPLNIGAAARAMLNFGFTRLTLVKPYEVAFREARSAVGAVSVLAAARVMQSLAPALTETTLVVGTSSPQGRVSRQPRRRLEEAAALLRDHLRRRPAALLFGSEKFGLSNEHLSYCHWSLRIPTDPACPSMNLGQAVALVCHEIARTSAPPSRRAVSKSPVTAAAQLDRITGRLAAVLDSSGYINPRTRTSHLLKIRRLVRRLTLTPPDAQVLEGMLRQIDWKLTNLP
ncbi:MAG: RNA methyltransferase, partial [Candidatus Rokuibacteriota bacterium]